MNSTRKLIYAATVLLIFAGRSIAQPSAWKQVNSPTELALEEVFFKSNDSGWAYGIFDRAYSTSDGGQSWTRVAFDSCDECIFHHKGMRLRDSTIYLFIELERPDTTVPVLYRSFDRGNTWVKANDAQQEKYNLYLRGGEKGSLQRYFTPYDAWAVADDATSNEFYGQRTIYRTDDNWETRDTVYSMQYAYALGTRAFFSDENHAYFEASRNGQSTHAFYTTNGTDWQEKVSWIGFECTQPAVGDYVELPRGQLSSSSGFYTPILDLDSYDCALIEDSVDFDRTFRSRHSSVDNLLHFATHSLTTVSGTLLMTNDNGVTWHRDYVTSWLTNTPFIQMPTNDIAYLLQTGRDGTPEIWRRAQTAAVPFKSTANEHPCDLHGVVGPSSLHIRSSSSFDILDIVGRRLKHFNASGEGQTIAFDQLPSGLVFLRSESCVVSIILPGR